MAPRFEDVPARADFEVGQRSPAFREMGKRFKKWLGPEIRHDGNGYQPGPVFSEFDLENVKLCQLLMEKKPTGVFSQSQWTTLMTSEPTRRYRVTAEALNVRARPDIMAKVVGSLHEGDQVKVTGHSRDRYWLKVSHRRLEGWSSHKFLTKIPLAPSSTDDKKTPWLPIAEAEIGVKEVSGEGDNARVVQYLRSTTLPADLAGEDETHWCSAFVNFVMEQAGFEGTDSAMARSWTSWGRKVERPVRGCIAVFERPEGGPTAGHVGFFMGSSGDTLSVLGGNQNDAVNIAPQSKSRLLSFRMPG